jgi:hypothetical protein
MEDKKEKNFEKINGVDFKTYIFLLNSVSFHALWLMLVLIYLVDGMTTPHKFYLVQ